MAITIKPQKNLQKAIDSFENPAKRTDIVKALNKTALRTKGVAFEAVLKEFAIERSAIKGKIYTSKASKKNLVAQVDARSSRFNLGKFEYSGGVGQRGKVKPRIKVKIKRKSPFDELKRAFVWRGIIMERKGNERYKLKGLQSVSLPQMLNNPSVRMTIENFADAELNSRLIGVL